MNTEQSLVNPLKDLYSNIKNEAIQDYFTFLRFQSISSEAEYKEQVSDCVDWLSDYLKAIGFNVEKWNTSGHPTLLASWLEAGPDKPTVLIYNHYDVQPVDPLEEWESPPFEPTIKDGTVYARGAQDNKGQCFYVIQAVKALMNRDGKLPVNVKLCIEGEEETGSVGLSELLAEKKEALQANYLVVADMGIPAVDTPAVTLGVRGIVTMDVEVSSSYTDLHSGTHGGVAFNPLHALVKILDALRDNDGKITIPGFYDDVQSMTEAQRNQLSLDFDPDHYEAQFGMSPSGGETAFSPLESSWLRPTLEVNGINGGYTGSGFKTVIPAKATAKISCRLVPDQDPHRIGKLVADHIESLAPKGVAVKVDLHAGGGTAVRGNQNSQIVKALQQAYSEVFNKPTQFIFEGGSIPVITELAKASESDVVLMGLGLATDQIHAPNEHFGLDRFEQGFLVITRTLEIMGE